MEKLNIAEILKDCPKGMELDCTMFDNVTFVGVNIQREFPIEIKAGRNTSYLTKEGCYHRLDYRPNAKCVIFPKGKTTWEGFQRPFKDGDIIYTHCKSNTVFISIFKEIRGEKLLTYCDLGCLFHARESNICCDITTIKKQRLATEEEKQELFDVIKAKGYRWNAETKTLEQKKKEYPKTYEECCEVLNLTPYYNVAYDYYRGEELDALYQLLVCRDAYWKIAGDWKPDWGKNSDNYNLIVYEGGVIKDINCGVNHVLSFPTSEMRDAFYENFKDLIEQCKELL